jgi:hypothetical protein
VQVFPLWVKPLYQIHFIGSAPILYLLLSGYRIFYVVMNLIIDKLVNIVFFREAISKIALVFKNSPREIRRHADIQRAVVAACHDVNVPCFHEDDSSARRVFGQVRTG